MKVNPGIHFLIYHDSPTPLSNLKTDPRSQSCFQKNPRLLIFLVYHFWTWCLLMDFFCVFFLKHSTKKAEIFFKTSLCEVDKFLIMNSGSFSVTVEESGWGWPRKLGVGCLQGFWHVYWRQNIFQIAVVFPKMLCKKLFDLTKNRRETYFAKI